MTSVALLVVLLVVLAGIIAYAGDQLGTWVGRRRLTVFGARPKLTGQIVGVGAGIVIMLTTLGVLAVAFNNATQTLINAQRTADELANLRAQERLLQLQLSDVRDDLSGLQGELVAAQAVIEQAEAERAAAVAERDAAAAERDLVEAERDALVAEISQTRTELDRLSQQLADARALLDELEAERDRADEERLQAVADRDAALQQARLARGQVEALADEVAESAAALDAANVRLLELQVALAEADANVAAAVERLDDAERATAAAERARVEAEAARAAADAERQAADAERDAAEVDRDAARAEADELRATAEVLAEELAALAAEVAALEQEAERLDAEAAALQQENVGLAARNDQLARANSDLLDRNEVLAQLNTSLQEEIVAGNELVRSLQGQVAGLTDRLEEESRRLSEVQQEFNRVASGEVTFERDQVIYSGAIYANEPSAVREELADFVRRASAATARRGAGEVVLTSAQFNSLVEVISETPDSDLVRLISPRNQFSPTQVEVVVEALENTRVFERGRLLVSRHIHLGSAELPATQDELRSAISLLKADALRMARRSGLDELQVPEYVGVSDESFTNQLLRLHGPVVIGVATVEPVDRAGPARVELVIVY